MIYRFSMLLTFIYILGSNGLFAQENILQLKADSLISLFEELDEKSRGRAFISATSQIMQSNVEDAKEFVSIISDFGESEKDTLLLINARALMAEYHWRKGDYKKGVELAQQSIELASQDERFEYELAKGYQTAGTIHLYLENAKEALAYYRKASPLYRSQGQIVSLASVLNNSGVVYMDAAKNESNPALMDSAAYYFQKVLEIRDQAKPYTVLNALGNLTSIYVSQEKWEQAEEISQEWIALEAQEPNETSRAMIYGILGELFLSTNRLEKARKYLHDGLDYAIDQQVKYEISEYYRLLTQLYKKENRYQIALEYAEKSWVLKDSLYNLEKINKISELEEKYQAAEREKEIQAVNAELEKEQRFKLFLITIISLVIVLGGIAIYLILQKSRLKNQLLSQEIDTLRVQINSIFDGGIKNLDVELDRINEGLFKPLSEREFEVLNQAISDKTNGEIAEALFLSVNTVKFHLKNVYEKLGVTNRKEALGKILSKA